LSARSRRSGWSTTSRATCHDEQLQTSKLTQTSRILDRNGKLIEALYHQNRTVVPPDQISIKLAARHHRHEDRSFYGQLRGRLPAAWS